MNHSSHFFGENIKKHLHSPTQNLNRVLGKIEGTNPGPLVVATAGMHGNEPTGIWAIQSLLEQLQSIQSTFAGTFIAFAGNTQALTQKSRFISHDLNRAWTLSQVKSIQEKTADFSISENNEQKELLSHFVPLIEEAKARQQDIYYLDLHTSSSHSVPFGIIGDTLKNQQFALPFPFPTILGLEEHIDGTLLEFLNTFGIVTFGFEAGQHDDPNSACLHEAMLWSTLVRLGCISEKNCPTRPKPWETLRIAGQEVPPVLEVSYRHPVSREDEFVMNPGFANFTRVQKGQELARDRKGPIYARETGRILLPLYQGQGDDGFFIGREMSPTEVKLAHLLRKLQFHEILRLFPGIEQAPETKNAFSIQGEFNQKWLLRALRLLGYRKERKQKSGFLFSKRNEE